MIGNDYRNIPNSPLGSQLVAGLGVAYTFIGQPERTVDWYRAQLTRGHDTRPLTSAALVHALAWAGRGDEAMAAAAGLIEAAEATGNPCALSFALAAFGHACNGSDPGRAGEALHRGLEIAHDSGNRYTETRLVSALAQFEANSGDPLAALDYFAIAIHHLRDAGNTAHIRGVLAALAACLDRLGCHAPAATIAGFTAGPVVSAVLPQFNTAIAHLRDVLGDQHYDSLAHKGETMTTAAMVTYAYDQIEHARTELNAVSK
jgi:tetratricopeptide (TPR) repeat protein